MKKTFISLAALCMQVIIAIPLFSQQDCANADVISALPYSATGLTTTGMGNDYDDSDACGSASMVNEDYVFSFTPASDMQINVALLNTSIVTSGFIPAANIGLFITDLCPDDPSVNCVAYVDNAILNPSLNNINLTSGTTYYIIVSSANTFLGDATNVNFDIEITKNIADDIAVTSVEGLVSACDLTQANVGCYITNNGTNPAAFFNVSYTINGGTPVVEGFPTTLAPMASEYFEFSTPADFPTDGEYEIVVSVSLTGDEETSNDSYTQSVTRYPVYSSFPFTEDFESNNGFFSAGGTASSWEYGNPDETLPELVINSAASGDYCWVTNLAGNTNMSETSYLETPCFDLSSLYLPTLDLNAWVEFSLYGNSANIQASTDGGTNWNITVYDFATTGGWENIIVQMPELAGETNVKFRINYTGGFLVANGIAIDDFTIKEAVLNDLAIIDIIDPQSGCGLGSGETVSIEIHNFGAQVQSNIPVDYSIDGGLTWLSSPETVSVTLQPGEGVVYTFVTHCDMSAYGDYEIVAKTINPGDEDYTNDEYSKTIVSQNTIAANGYVESFESGSAGWYTYGENSTMELAMPANSLINSAADGSYAWVTNATGYNDTNEVSYLESPCFDFTGMVNPKIKAMVQYETNQLMSNFYVEYSIDGMTWDTVTAGLASTGWYGTGMISFGTWNGSSAGWIQVATDVPMLADQSSVKFRFVFDNGLFSMANTEGVAVDKFEIADCNLLPNAEFSYAINGLEVSFINESENADTYDWNFGDNDFFPSTSTEENPSFTYLAEGTYYVVLTVTNECSSSEYGTYIDVVTASEILNAENISIYPNPATSLINISGVNAERFEIINANGQVISDFNATSDVVTIDIRNLSAGNYFIKIIRAEGNTVVSFVKE